LLSLGVLVFLAVTGISAVFSSSRGISIFGNFIQPDAFWSFLVGGLAFFLAAVFFKKEDFPKIGICLFASLVLTAILGLLQIFGKFIFPWDFSRQTSFNTIGSVFGLGIFAALGLAMIVAALSGLKLGRTLKIYLSLAGILFFFILLILNNQLLWLGLALAMLFPAVCEFVRRANINIPLVIIVASLFFILINRQMPVLISVPTEIKPNLAVSLSVARGVLTGTRILFGSGPATFGYDYSQFRPTSLNQTAFWPIRFNQGANFFATLLSTLGVLGILAVIFFVFVFFKKAFAFLKTEVFSGNQTVDAGGISLIIFTGMTFLIINLFFYPVFFVELLFIFLGLGLLATGSKKVIEMDFHSSKTEEQSAAASDNLDVFSEADVAGGEAINRRIYRRINGMKNLRGFAVFLGTIVSLSFALFFVYLIIQKYTAAVFYAKGLQSSSVEKSAVWLEKAVRWDSSSDQYLRALSQARLSQGNELTKTILTQENTQNIQTQFQNIIASAVDAARRAAELNPIDSLNWFNLGNVYENLIPIVNQADVFAEDSYNKAIERDPKNPQGFVDSARALIISIDRNPQDDVNVIKEKLEKTESVLKKSIALKPDYAPANFLMAQIYIRQGDLAKAIVKVEEVARANMGDPGIAFQLGFLYYKNNQINQAQNELERAAVLSENYSNARYFLGLIYDQKGLKQKAIEQFEKIAQFNPDNQEVKNILNNLRAGRSALEAIVPPAQPPGERIKEPVGE